MNEEEHRNDILDSLVYMTYHMRPRKEPDFENMKDVTPKPKMIGVDRAGKETG